MGDDSSADAAKGQVSTNAAEVYEEFFVPALFAQWVEQILDAADVHEGDRVIDVGAGTGIVARAALQRVGPTGSVIAVDPNDGMLAVAAKMAPQLDIRPGTAERLPVDDDEIDCTTCQFALMFFDDRSRAISEMARVTRPGGHVAVATWAAVEESPGYAAIVDLLGDVIGDWAAEALRAPFTIGTRDQLADLLRPCFPEVSVQRREGQAHFESLDQWLHTDIRGWTLAERVDDEQFRRLRKAASRELDEFVGEDGRVTFAAPALLATATAA
ncbi:class I SAM-dependent methyltransferase [Mycobacterium sp. IDR2000157661]|uniref:class I SAM-dependent methyltransferase n=1 Tax=Mycobacterium sp. IDR2000157661 TaxID=2867005 RepID=UPI001EEB1421|nr:class I SAM-dependent methyltransferase [Mycobacterium sp. IDR2000157661]ULE31569.1 methyltransferase domain-containing protein [Mycobacterium sp. IDR2000157661]